jgi:predicted nucleotidyltransferase
MNNDSSNIQKVVRQFSQFISTIYPLKLAILFGSHAKGIHNEESDIDMLFVFEEKIADDLPNQTLAVARRAEFPLDALVFSTEEFFEALRRPSFVLLDALTDGQVIFDDGLWKQAKAELQRILEEYELVRLNDGWKFNPQKIAY